MKITLGDTWLVGLGVIVLGVFCRAAGSKLVVVSTPFSPTESSPEMTRPESEERFAQDEPEPPPPQLPPFNPLGPYFDSNTPTNITAQFGKTAYLSCMVRQLGNKSVSWVRHSDLHILTVGRYTYISDQRFQAYHLANTDDWTLQIRYTQLRDAGIYECQVSTEPKMSLLINLNVVVPQAKILGGPDIYVKTGSTLTLQCEISLCPEPPVYIFWYHEEAVINYATSRRTVHVETLKDDTTVSKLVINNAQPSDSGNYTCTPSVTDSTSATVHVLNGEKPAAMQHGKHSTSARFNASACLLFAQGVIHLLWRIGLI